MDIIYKPFSRESEINPISLPTANPTLPKNTFQSTPPEGYKREFLEPAAQPTEKPTSQIKPLPDNIFRMKIVSAKTTSLETPTQNRIQGFLDQLEKHNIKVNVTSRNRPGAKTKQGRTSFHATNDAVDITPVGQTFEQLREQIGQIPELLKYMRDNSLGILDETTPEMLAKTGGTGAHWHVGPDKSALSGFRNWYGKTGGKIPIYQKGRKYNPNASLAERGWNWFTDKVGWTSEPTYTDGYGIQRSQESARNEADLQRIKTATKNTGEALLVGAAGALAIETLPATMSILANPYVQAGFVAHGGARAPQTVKNVKAALKNGDRQEKVNAVSDAILNTAELLPMIGAMKFPKKLIKTPIKRSFTKTSQEAQRDLAFKEAVWLADQKTTPYQIPLEKNLLYDRLISNTTRELGYPKQIETKYLYGISQGSFDEFLLKTGTRLDQTRLVQQNHIVNKNLIQRKSVTPAEFVKNHKHLVLSETHPASFSQNNNILNATILDNPATPADVFRNQAYNPFTRSEKVAEFENIPMHELIHKLNIHRSKFLSKHKVDFLKKPSLQETDPYVFSADELDARINDIKNFLKIRDGNKRFTGPELKQAFENHIKNAQIDNQISDVYNQISDWEKFAKWANKISPVIIPGMNMIFDDKKRETQKFQQGGKIIYQPPTGYQPQYNWDIFTKRTINEGETLSNISNSTGVSTTELAVENKLQDPNKIQAGQQINIPATRDDVLPEEPGKKFLNMTTGEISDKPQEKGLWAPLWRGIDMPEKYYQPSDEVVNLIKGYEQFRSYIYDDATGKRIPAGQKATGTPTIGYGTTLKSILDKYKTHDMTEEEAVKYMTDDLKYRVADLEKYDWWDYLNQNQRDAILSYHYNVGETKFRKEHPKLHAALRAKNWTEAAKQMDADMNDPVYTGNRERRLKEQELFLRKIN